MHSAAQPLARGRAKLLALLVAFAATAVFALGVGASTAQACGGGQLCAWTGTFFTGSEYFLGCPSGPTPTWIGLFPEAYSAKNNCGGWHVQIGWREGGTINWKACMSPGGDRPNPGRINAYRGVANC